MRSSWPILGVGALVFLAGFWSLRARSTFLAAEAQATVLRELARAHGVSPASVLALRVQAPDVDDAAFAARVGAFARLAPELGEQLAAVALVQGEDVARALQRRAVGDDGDDGAAWPQLRSDPAALAGVEFEALRRRFAERRSGRTR